MARSGKRVVLAAIAAASLLVAALLGYDIARRAAGPTAATSSTSPANSANQLALSVFEQPRRVPETRFRDDQGHELTLADFRGQVVLLNVWATWCVPCRMRCRPSTGCKRGSAARTSSSWRCRSTAKVSRRREASIGRSGSKSSPSMSIPLARDPRASQFQGCPRRC